MAPNMPGRDRYHRTANVDVAMSFDVDAYWDLVLDAIDALGKAQ